MPPTHDGVLFLKDAQMPLKDAQVPATCPMCIGHCLHPGKLLLALVCRCPRSVRGRGGGTEEEEREFTGTMQSVNWAVCSG